MEQQNRESSIAIIIIALCVLALLLGFIQKPESKTEAASKSGFASILSQDKIMVLGLEGVIYDSFRRRGPFSSNAYSVSSLKEGLRDAVTNDKVVGVLLRLNSPGGTVGASQEIYKLIQEVRATKKPVLVSMGDVCASGCYYLSAAADHIVANPGTLTGSIGVISSSLNFNGLMAKLGIEDQTFTAGKYKDLGSSQRVMSEEDRRIMQALLDDSYDQFLTDIEIGRGIPRSKLNKIAEGLIYTGRQALDVGLVDELGAYDQAKLAIKKLLTEQGYKNVEALVFDEPWNQTKLSRVGDLLGFDLSETSSSIASSLFTQFGQNTKVQGSMVTMSKYQPLWMLP